MTLNGLAEGYFVGSSSLHVIENSSQPGVIIIGWLHCLSSQPL